MAILSIRKKLRVTPVEEDHIIKEVKKAVIGLIECDFDTKIELVVDEMLSKKYDSRDYLAYFPDDEFNLKYKVSLTGGILRSFLGQKRKGKKSKLKLDLE